MNKLRRHRPTNLLSWNLCHSDEMGERDSLDVTQSHLGERINVLDLALFAKQFVHHLVHAVSCLLLLAVSIARFGFARECIPHSHHGACQRYHQCFCGLCLPFSLSDLPLSNPRRREMIINDLSGAVSWDNPLEAND